MDDDPVSDAIWQLQPSTHWLRVTTINVPTRGEPRRMITGGLPPIPGRTVLEERGSFRDYDHVFTDLLWEPRGHADMYGAVVTASFDADLDIFFLHNKGYSTMCGHAIITLTKLATEAGPVRNDINRPQLTINVAAGNIHAQAIIERRNERYASLRRGPSFLCLRGLEMDVRGLGRMHFDVAYRGRRIEHAVVVKDPVTHPFEEDLSVLCGTLFIGPALTSPATVAGASAASVNARAVRASIGPSGPETALGE